MTQRPSVAVSILRTEPDVVLGFASMRCTRWHSGRTRRDSHNQRGEKSLNGEDKTS
jgi:hypothetical protein